MERRTTKVSFNLKSDIVDLFTNVMKQNLETYVRGKSVVYLKPFVTEQMLKKIISADSKVAVMSDYNINLETGPIYLAHEPILSFNDMTLSFIDDDINPLPEGYETYIHVGRVWRAEIYQTDKYPLYNTISFTYRKPRSKSN